ncbi:hypothetical protein PCANC_12723 [Puccinia coronata f. sp. avenae]|uniref:Srp40 C-terminal domain-containing protein n=1 Tax=Puccinia coronata f. sp. avenae TaxID=200324 RepID=A0A2N5SY14_9BASI|nr:hypothetical protein PCANC_12723 [Puccinia coronata f. sp. avenae]
MFAGERSGRTGGVSRRKAAATPTTAESLRVHSLLRREFADWCQREGLESTLKALQKELGNKGITIGGTDSSCAPQPGNPSTPSTSTHAITSSSSAPQHGRLATVKKTGGIQAQAPKDTNTKGIAQSTTPISITESESGSGTDSDEESSDSDSSKSSSSSSSSGESDSDSSKSSSSPTKSDKPAHLTAAKNTGGIAAQAPEKVIGQSTKPIPIAGSESGSGTDSDEESSDSDSTAKSPSSSTKSGSDSSSSATKSQKPETLAAVKKTGGIITQTPKNTDKKKVIGQSTQPIVITGSDSSSGTESSDEESSDSDSSKSSSSSSSSSSTEDSDSSTSSSAESDSDSSDSSSSSDSDSDSSDSSSSSDSDSDSSDSSSSSDSDSSSSSSTESSSDSSNSSSSSSASSTSSSSTETDSDSRDQESLANPTPASNSVSATKRKALSPPQSPDAKRIKAPEPSSSATLNPPTASNSTQGLVNDGKQKKTNAPFRRVKAEEIALDQRLSDNSFLAKGGAEGSYGYKAHQDLIVTRGKAFTV